MTRPPWFRPTCASAPHASTRQHVIRTSIGATTWDLISFSASRSTNWVKPGEHRARRLWKRKLKNILNAFEEANKIGATTICYSGFQGGKALNVAKINVVVPHNKMVQVEDIHLMINHMIADELKRLVQNRTELVG